MPKRAASTSFSDVHAERSITGIERLTTDNA